MPTEFKKLWKYFVFIFLITFLIINWNEISWIFNYKVIFGFFSDFFQKGQEQETVKLLPLTENKNINFEYSDKEDRLEIPKIEISVPLVFVENENEVSKALDRGVVHFPSSALPGETGQTIILGHSAPPGWPKIKYQWVFSQINDLEVGDEIFVYFDNKKYTYSVNKKIFLEKREELPQDLTSSDNMLILISCWPPGKDIRRIAVVAK